MTTGDDLGDLLRDRARDVPPHWEVPGSLARRVRRRVALNAIAVAAALSVVAAGAFIGVRAFNDPKPAGPVGFPTSTPQPTQTTNATPTAPATQPTPQQSSTAVCTSGQLRAVGTLEGAAGSREGEIDLTNFSDTNCTLEGTPTVTLLDQNLHPIDSGIDFSSSPPGWKVDGKAPPPGWPVVKLEPGDVAKVRIRWSNWCNGSAPLWQVSIPGSGTDDVFGLDAAPPPPCNGQGQNSSVEVGPFEPGPDS
ncbi:MAG: DUF4232 domain-containing protein [Actinomycetota bacterium]